MVDFTAYNPTKLRFGQAVVSKYLAEELEGIHKVAILTGKGSAEKNGSMADVKTVLDGLGIQFIVFSGIKPNPTTTDADSAISLVKEFGTQAIISIGGGSTIDTAKVVAIAAKTEGSAWELMTGEVKSESTLPHFVVLTLAATGTEMNSAAVLQEPNHEVKRGWSHPLGFPKASFCDPTYTLTVPKAQIANGLSDTVAHALELFFGPTPCPISDHFAVDVVKCVMDLAPKIIAEPDNYEYRAQMMWLSTVALNGTLASGKKGGDWGVHSLEHSLSFVTDIAHGAGLAAIYPAWLRYFNAEVHEKLAFLGERLGKELCPDGDAIAALEHFYQKIGLKASVQSLELPKSEVDATLQNAIKNRVRGVHFGMDEACYRALLGMD